MYTRYTVYTGGSRQVYRGPLRSSTCIQGILYIQEVLDKYIGPLCSSTCTRYTVIQGVLDKVIEDHFAVALVQVILYIQGILDKYIKDHFAAALVYKVCCIYKGF